MDRIARSSSPHQRLETNAPPSMSEAAEGPPNGRRRIKRNRDEVPCPPRRSRIRQSKSAGFQRARARVLWASPARTRAFPKAFGTTPSAGPARTRKERPADAQPTPRWTGSLEAPAPINASKPTHRHRCRKQQRDRQTGADASSETGTKFPAPHVGGESDNQKARDSKGPALGSFGPVRRGQARFRKRLAPRHQPVRRGREKSAPPTPSQLRGGPDR